jgi:hypothetical protein
VTTTHFTRHAKTSEKSLQEQIDVVAEFHAHKINPERIAFRTGIDFEFVSQLVSGDIHQRLFAHLLSRHRKSRRDQRLKKSLRIRGIRQATLQDEIELEYTKSLTDN